MPSPTVAGIGASAGGLEALKALFDALPERPGIAFVVIVHRSPEHESSLAEILDRHTAMPVAAVSGAVPLEADRVYVIPPGHRLVIADGHVDAVPFAGSSLERAPIDAFFRSLAAAHDDGFAIVLSGGGSDGALGVRAVKGAGGLVLVQDPAEALFDSMPRAAIATGVADLVLPLAELAARLGELAATKRRVREHFARLLDQRLSADDEAELGRILAYVRARTGHDFSRYKRATVLRRVFRRMQVARVETLADYCEHLRDDEAEPRALFDDLLITVTAFFPATAEKRGRIGRGGRGPADGGDRRPGGPVRVAGPAAGGRLRHRRDRRDRVRVAVGAVVRGPRPAGRGPPARPGVGGAGRSPPRRCPPGRASRPRRDERPGVRVFHPSGVSIGRRVCQGVSR